jgi:hypothetical protein
MREGSPNQFPKNAPVSDLKTEAKSLFRKILAISRYGSRFCPDRLISTNGNSNEMRILGQCSQKKLWGGGASDAHSATTISDSETRRSRSEISLARPMAAS